MAKAASESGRTAIVVHHSDNVATALVALAAGRRVELDVGGEARVVIVEDAIPRGHKLALCEIRRGGKVVKYGETIGLASSRIGPGEHVHVENVRSRRGRGDLAARGRGRTRARKRKGNA